MPTQPPRLKPFLVADAPALQALAEALTREPAVALDTESNSFHVHRERVCLLQISTREADWVVDPFAVDVRPLGPVLAAAPALVLHGADYDVRCLKREYGFVLPALFDTMAAARRLGRAGLGLSALVEEQFGVRLSKDFQRSDWGRRPLTVEQVSYAALDTHFLLPLHEVLARELRARDLWDEAAQEFGRIAAVEPRPRVFDPEGWRKMKGARDLDAPGRAVLRTLWVAREERASALDRPPFKVMPEQSMVEVARRRPGSEQELLRVPGVTTVVLRRMGEAVLAAIREGQPPAA
ncbi:MAG TPA: ribonuclease D [Anaeromyxobacteraceae bacterium]